MEHIFEVGKLQCAVDIQRNQSQIFHAEREIVKPTLFIYFIQILVFQNKRLQYVPQLLESLSKHPSSDVPIEELEVAIQVIHEYPTEILVKITV